MRRWRCCTPIWRGSSFSRRRFKALLSALKRVGMLSNMPLDLFTAIHNPSRSRIVILIRSTKPSIVFVNPLIQRVERKGLSAQGRFSCHHTGEFVLTCRRPQSSGLTQYISAMKRVEKALVDLNTTNLRSNQKAMSDFNSLLSAGTSQLQDMLHSELALHATTIEPLHYLTKGTGYTEKQNGILTNCFFGRPSISFNS